MSSAEEDSAQTSRKRSRSTKVRACDVCRRKKIRCDGPQGSGSKCSNCIVFKTDCKYEHVAKKRGPPKGYVQGLETRVAKLEEMLREVRPELIGESTGMPESRGSPSDRIPDTSVSDKSSPLSTNPEAGDAESSDDDTYIQNTLAEHLSKLSVNPSHQRFFGKSSGIALMKTAMAMKGELYPGECNSFGVRRRPEFWSVSSWEIPTYQEESPIYEFPPPDLLLTLVDLYFNNANLISPLLHRPTFENNVRTGLHKRDERFGQILLVVCAIGSRHSDDPRVLADDTPQPQSSGWKWFNQAQTVRKSLLAPPTLYDLQLYCLFINFLMGSSAPQALWMVVGIGIRFALDVGAHKRKSYPTTPTVDTELWKRAFWILVHQEIVLSAAVGKPCTLQEEDIDAELPIECDDEFWVCAEPSASFKQPRGVPAKVSFFNSRVKLDRILAFALRTIYSTTRYRTVFGYVGPDWEQRIVADLDSDLNKWFDSVPDHLRWDPTKEDPIFFRQSAILHATYHNVQIVVHRPFISSKSKPSPLSYPCMASCANAARSMSNIIDTSLKRCGPLPDLLLPTFTASIVLMLLIIGDKRSPSPRDPAKGLEDVHKFLTLLRALEERWHFAGALWDIIWHIGSVGGLPLSLLSTSDSRKRSRNSDDLTNAPPTHPPQSVFRIVTPPQPVRPSTGGEQILAQTASDLAESLIIDPINAHGSPGSLQGSWRPGTGEVNTEYNTNKMASSSWATPSYGPATVQSRAPSAYTTVDSMDDFWSSLRGQVFAPPLDSVSPASASTASSSQLAESLSGTPSQNDPADSRFLSSAPQADMFTSANPSPYYPSWTSPRTQFPTQPMSFDFPAMDNSTMALWSNMPLNLELNDWGAFIDGISGITQDSGNSTSGLG
ncbi:hypothetical protein JAAARDRAFT_195593 [Jaapia argillacea MUCL 33604]|uniref:Zn(2)-C6 fungal-type domain-containing protein n=1 Tax=Jaapia argillacea MUCL 33604 TaxID=933084 RepID=A0A067PPP0_9AGAM|nr:hypothetical protein JAAARDRAFT_195593 [Jaapia argillacea MUCL 33604]